MTTRSILDKEKENSEFKIQLMNSTLSELKTEVNKKTREHEDMLDDNKKLYSDNENLKRLLRVYKEKMDSE